MDGKKIAKVCFFIIAIFFVLAMIEGGIRMLASFMNQKFQEREEQKQQEAEYQSDEEQAKRQIQTFLKDITDAIHDKDYAYVLNALDETYREYKFNNDEKLLKEYIMKNHFDIENDEILRIDKKGGKYQILMGTMSGNHYSSIGYTVNIIDKNRCTFMFDEYTAFQKMNQIGNYLMKYEVRYYYETEEMMCFVVDIYNQTANSVAVELVEKATLVMTNGKEYQGASISPFTIQSGETQRIELLFEKQSEGKSYLKMNVAENGVTQEIIISLEEDIM